MTTIKLMASGLHCKSCAAVIQDVLEEKGAKSISVIFDEKTNSVEITCDYDKKTSELVLAIENEGYKVKQ